MSEDGNPKSSLLKGLFVSLQLGFQLQVG